MMLLHLNLLIQHLILKFDVLIERFNYLECLELNKKKLSPTSYRMVNKITTQEEIDSFINNTNYRDFIVFCIPDDPKFENIIKFNVDGSLSICLDNDLNLTNYKLVNNIINITNISSKIKISIPRGINLKFDSPNYINYINSIGYECTKVSVIDKEEITDNTILNNNIFEDILFEIFIDVNKFKNVHKTLLLKKDSEIINLIFTPIFVLGNNWSNCRTEVDTIIIQNTEFFKTFNDILGIGI